MKKASIFEEVNRVDDEMQGDQLLNHPDIKNVRIAKGYEKEVVVNEKTTLNKIKKLIGGKTW